MYQYFVSIFSAHLERTLDQAKSEITVKTDETLEKQKFIATEVYYVNVHKLFEKNKM